MREGSYLNGVAEIGALEHSLTTDLLNHLVFVQKVFMKEVNEVVQKMAGGDKPVPLWSEGDFTGAWDDCEQRPPSAQAHRSRPRELLFSLQLRLRGITMTGTTPTQSAVRLETGAVELHLSNRIDASPGVGPCTNRIHGKAQVDLNLALGQLIRNDMFEEAEPELQQLAYFKTRINLRNAFHHELSSVGAKGEVVLISLTRPLVCVQPLAVDRAVLVWLNYRNAYDYWNEQRASRNKEVLTATQQVFEKVPQLPSLAPPQAGGGERGGTSSPRTNLFLQLTVDDLGVCLPLNPATTVNQQVDSTKTRDALVMALESTSISACNSGSLVCKAHFTGFCLRFAPEFETSLDEWKPELSDPTIMNLCTVSEGTYEVCSRTRSPNPEKGTNAKWLLHVGWQMEGVDLLLDVNIGKQLSALARTLTTITGSPDGTAATPGRVTPNNDLDSDEEEDSDVGCDFSASQPESASSRRQAFQFADSLPASVLDPNMDPRQRAKLLEIEMNEQAKTVAALKSVGASEAWVEQEMRRLQELEAAVFYDFRRDVMQKLRRQSVKANSMRDRLGLAAKSSGGGHLSASKSFRIPSPTLEMTEPTQLQESGGSSSDPLSLSLDEGSSLTTEPPPPLSPALYSPTAATAPVSASGRPPPILGVSPRPDSEGSSHHPAGGAVTGLSPNTGTANSPHQGADGGAAAATAANAAAAQHGGTTGSHDPSIDLELDVQVCISSGQCILYNKDFSKEEDNRSRLKKERSFSGVIYDLGGGAGGGLSASSPGSMRRKGAGGADLSHHQLSSSAKLRQPPPTGGSGVGGGGSGSAKLRHSGQSHAASSSAMADCTVFFIPGLDVKVHYESHNESHSHQVESPSEAEQSGWTAAPPSSAPPPQPSPRFGTKDLNPNITDDFINNLSSRSKQQQQQQQHSRMPSSSNSANFSTSTANTSNTQTPSTLTNQTTPNTTTSATPTNATSAPTTNVGGSTATTATAGGGVPGSQSGGKKHASLFTWLTLQSIPEETVICPNILDFLELALEPLPLPQPQKTPTESGEQKQDVSSDVFTVSGDAGVAVSGGQYSSFPVDVIVYFHMQPCTIRFSCQPVSRVECLLQLPSLNLVFSSKRANDDCIPEDCCSGGTGAPPAGGSSADTKLLASSVGGLSVTGVLEDFSLFVFHPYGGKMARRNIDSERRDSLIVTVEFVKFQISRTRKMNITDGSGGGTGKEASSDRLGKQTPGTAPDAASRAAVIRFSTIIDIGTALFKYDMRRLAEILAFPKAWYRRTIVRRLFLGDLGILSTVNEMMEDDDGNAMAGGAQSSSTSKESSENSRRESSNSSNIVNGSANTSAGNASRTQQTCPPSPQHTTPSTAPRPRDKLWLNLEEAAKKNSRVGGVPDRSSTSGEGGVGVGGNTGSWETLVLFAANFKKLDVHINMGNVMGNVVWSTKGFQANGRLSIGSSGHKDMYIGLGLGGSNLEAKGGIVGGIIELSTINTYLKIKEDPGTEPDHTFGVKLFACQSRLDYMGTSVLMLRVSSCGVTLRDEWTVLSSLHGPDADDATRRGATIFIIGDLEWDQLQLLISKSTTADLLKMYHKLEEFFTQQFKSSRLVFFSLQPNKPKQSIRSKDRGSQANKKVASVLSVNMAVGGDVHHHRHWHRVLAKVSGLQLATLPVPLPAAGTVLGGSLELHGNTISLACFHGLNFKSKSWALFSLKEPLINFTTEVQETLGDSCRDTHIIQNLILSLGVLKQAPVQHVSMATVLRVTRNMVFPPQFRTLQDWFHYAFYTSELDNVDRFPVLDDSRTEGATPGDAKRSSGPPLKEHNHSTETIFAFPSLEIHLNSKQRQAPTTPDFLGPKPRVETSLVTEFQDHIFVTVDAENFFFLHDLISSYIKDTKDKMGNPVSRNGEGGSEAEDSSTGGPTTSTRGGASDRGAGGRSGSKFPSTAGGQRVNEPTQFLQQDWREFTCNTWHLEPTVRLLSWAAKNLDPYGVDYILNRLGFSQASTTIPKWLQRGCMDPLDKLLSLLMVRIITALHNRDQDHD